MLAGGTASRPTVAREADLTRVIRQLLRELKRQVLGNVSATVSVDYDDTTLDGLNVIAMAKVPSLVLSGPTLRPNRFYSANVAHEDVVGGVSGPELVRRKPPYTVDLVFTLTAASGADRRAVQPDGGRRDVPEPQPLDRAAADPDAAREERALGARRRWRVPHAARGKDDVRVHLRLRGARFRRRRGLPSISASASPSPSCSPTQAIATGGAP